VPKSTSWVITTLGRRGLAIEPTDAVAVPSGTFVAAHFTHLGSVFLS
jgi:hypothetical protein